MMKVHWHEEIGSAVFYVLLKCKLLLINPLAIKRLPTCAGVAVDAKCVYLPVFFVSKTRGLIFQN